MTATIEHFPFRDDLNSDEVKGILASIESEEPLCDKNTLPDDEKDKIDEIAGKLQTHNAFNEEYLKEHKQIMLRDCLVITNEYSQYITVFYSIFRIKKCWKKFIDLLYKGTDFVSKSGKFAFKTIKLLSPSFSWFSFAPRLIENFNCNKLIENFNVYLFYVAPPQNNEQLALKDQQIALQNAELAHKDQVIAFERQQNAIKDRQIQALQEDNKALKARCKPIEPQPHLTALKANHVAMEELSMPTSNEMLNLSPVLTPSHYPDPDPELIHLDHHAMLPPLVEELSFSMPPMPVLCH